MPEMIVAVATVVRSFHLESLVDERAPLDVGVSLLPLGALPCRLRASSADRPM